MIANTSAERLFRRDWAQHPSRHAVGYRSTILRAPTHAPVPLEPSEGDLARPVFTRSELLPDDNDLLVNYAHAMGLDGEPIGERIILHGLILDERGRPLPDTLVEMWQANAGGRYRHHRDSYVKAPLDPHFGGFGRCLTDQSGGYVFRTIRPGPYPFPNRGSDWRPAHIHFSLFGEAFGQRLVTQIYFEGDPLIPFDPIANTIADRASLDRLVAKLDMGEMRPYDCLAYRFDFVLRGRQQTFFENRPEGL